MDTIFMNSGNSKTPDPHKLLLNLSEVALWNLSIYYAWKNIEKSYKNNKPKISAPAWNEVFEFPDVSYSVSDIQEYFEYILTYMEKRLMIIIVLQ